MKTKKIEVCDAIFIDISCEYNDPVDVRCGGPAVTGYEFYVSPDEKEEDLRKFVTDMVKKYRRPFMGVSFSIKKNYPVEHLWTKERMEQCIKDNWM